MSSILWSDSICKSHCRETKFVEVPFDDVQYSPSFIDFGINKFIEVQLFINYYSDVYHLSTKLCVCVCRWMCGVSLRDRKKTDEFWNMLGIKHVLDVIQRGRFRGSCFEKRRQFGKKSDEYQIKWKQTAEMVKLYELPAWSRKHAILTSSAGGKK